MRASAPTRCGRKSQKRTDSTRKGHAASVTLLRREQLHKVVRPYIPKYRRGAKSQKRADEGIGPYKARRKIVETGGRPYKVHCVEAGNVPLLAEGDVWHILF